MVTSAKVFWVIAGMYVLTIFIPALMVEVAPDAVYLHHAFPHEAMRRTTLACALFVVGLGLGALAFRFGEGGGPASSAGATHPGYVTLVAVTAVIALYVLVAGPPAPFFASFTLSDPDAILFAREDAVKLNPDVVFVRLYSWGRDIFAPVTFILSIQALRKSAVSSARAVAIAGLLAAVFLGLWSGHKATVVNYMLAAFIFAAADIRSMARTVAIMLPALAIVVAAMFWITLPQLAGDPDAARILSQAIANRLFFAPFEVATAYIDALDRLRAIRPQDALPYLSFLWSPNRASLENAVGIQYFTANVESSIHANGAAFSYAYVLGGLIGCFLAGLVIMAGLRVAVAIVGATRSPFVLAAFHAALSYIILDLLNGNFVSYLLKIIALAVLSWGAYCMTPALTIRRISAHARGS